MRPDKWDVILMAALLAAFFVAGLGVGVAIADAAYRPAVAVQDEGAISCGNPAERHKALEVARQMHATTVRINAIQNMNPIFQCNPVAAIQAVAAEGFRPYVTVVGSPTYARTLARTVGHLVPAWGIWNEPNHPGWQFGYMANSKGPSSYRKLVVRMTRQLRKHDPGSKVLLGEAAPLEDLRFLQRTSKKGQRTLRLDGIALHAYRWYEPPYATTIGGMRGYIRTFNRTARKMARERRLCRPGLRRKVCRPVRVYITEAGYLRQDRGIHPIYSSYDVAQNLVGSWVEACRGKVAMMMHYQLIDNGNGSWDTALIGEWGPLHPSVVV